MSIELSWQQWFFPMNETEVSDTNLLFFSIYITFHLAVITFVCINKATLYWFLATFSVRFFTTVAQKVKDFTMQVKTEFLLSPSIWIVNFQFYWFGNPLHLFSTNAFPQHLIFYQHIFFLPFYGCLKTFISTVSLLSISELSASWNTETG